MSETIKLRTIPHIFHANLSDAYSNEDYWLQVMGQKCPLQLHTDETRLLARKSQPLLSSVPDHHLTHFTASAVHMPYDQIIRMHVRHTVRNTNDIPGEFGMSHTMIFIPPAAPYEELLTRGVMVHDAPIDWVSTAKSLLFHHGDLITKDPTTGGVIMEHMDKNTARNNYLLIEELAMFMRKKGNPTASGGWAKMEEFDAGTYGMKYTMKPVDEVVAFAGKSMTAVMKSTKNDTRLEQAPPPAYSAPRASDVMQPAGGTWTQQAGQSVEIAGQTFNSLELLAKIDTTAANEWKAALAATGTSGLTSSISIVDADKRKLKIRMENTYIRFLSAYIQFIDADGNIMDIPDWQPDDDGIVAAIADALGLNYKNMRFIGIIGPINTAFAIPIYADPGELEVTVTFPPGAVGANIYGCGIGVGNNQYPLASVIGGVFTGMANLGIPTLFLGLAVAAQTYKPLYKIMGDKKFIITVVGAGVLYFGGKFAMAGVNKKMDWKAFSSLLQILFSQGATKALVWAEMQIVEGQLADQIPFAGWIMIVINIATTAAQLAQTIVAVCTSPWQIRNAISTTITSVVKVHPDPRNKAFPQAPAGSKATYVVKMIYQADGYNPVVAGQSTRPTISSPITEVPAGSTPTVLIAQFTNTLGGKVKFEVDFYIDSWMAGKAVTAWMANNAESTSTIDLYLFQQPIPLDKDSVYKHTNILTYSNDAYQFTPQAAPCTATLANANTSGTGNAISLWTGLALSQRYGMIGLSWKAAGTGLTACSDGSGGQLFTFQNINIPGTPMDSVKFPSCGLTGLSQLVYDVFPAKFLMENGQFVIKNGYPVPDPADKCLGNFYIDPRKADNDPEIDGGYHLREVVLDRTTPFNMSTVQPSWGRFPFFPDSMTMHPSGYAVGVNQKSRKMMITPIQPTGVKDDAVPLALAFAGEALNTDRPGLLYTPVAITCSYAGTILVLEQLASEGLSIARVQAFDLNGNPVNSFLDKDKKPTPFLELPNNLTYLDMVAVGDNKTTYLYIARYANSGQDAADYTMAIYKYGEGAEAGNYLVETKNIPAAKLNVDMWHTLYTLDYAMTTDGKGNNAGPKGPNTGPAGRTVPSVSTWLPPIKK